LCNNWNVFSIKVGINKEELIVPIKIPISTKVGENIVQEDGENNLCVMK
jgi:hypothetical protein